MKKKIKILNEKCFSGSNWILPYDSKKKVKINNRVYKYNESRVYVKTLYEFGNISLSYSNASVCRAHFSLLEAV